MGVNFGNKSCVTCSSCSYLVLVDLEFVLARSTFVCCSVAQVHLQVTLGHIEKLLIQTLFSGSSEILYFVQILNSRRNFLHRVGSSDIRQTNPLRRIFKIFSGSPIHPPSRHHQDPFRNKFDRITHVGQFVGPI